MTDHNFVFVFKSCSDAQKQRQSNKCINKLQYYTFRISVLQIKFQCPCMTLVTSQITCNIVYILKEIAQLTSKLKAHANGRNKQLLRVVGQKCCIRLYGPKSLTGFKLYATSANKCQHCYGSMQTDATCWAQQCCVLLANNVASVCIGLKNQHFGNMWGKNNLT